MKKEDELIGEEVILTTRPSQNDRLVLHEKQDPPLTARPS